MSANSPVMNGSAFSAASHRLRAESDGSDDQFLDMLANFQDDRLDDQRCGLPEKIEPQGSAMSMVELPGNGFWCDGWVSSLSAEIGDASVADLRNLSWEIKRDETPTYYRLQFMNKDHDNYYCEDEKLGTLLMSLRCELTSNIPGNSPDSWEDYRVIVRTPTETTCKVVSSSKFSSAAPRAEDIAKVVLDQPSISIARMHPAPFEQVPDLIARFDEHGMQTKHKFGIVFQRLGQTTEDELFGNENHGAALEEFLDLLGERVELRGFTGYAGGLDVKNGTTGETSVYTVFQDRQIMFHVSTLLPFKEKGDNQQLERKRHIGNDIVAIVFQNDATPFIAGSITSQFLQAVIIVQVVEPISETTRYKLSVVAKDGMANFAPDIPQPAIFAKNDHFRSWLLTKLVNAEVAAKETPHFTKLQARTRTTLLQNLVDRLKEFDEKAEAAGGSGRLLSSMKSKFGSLPSLVPKKQRHSIDTGILSHNRNVSPFAATESHDLVTRRRLSEQSPTRPHLYKPLHSDPVSETSDELRIRREKSKMRRKDMLNRVHTSLQNFQRPNSATLPASWKKKSASSYQSPSTETSSTEQSPDGSVSSLVGAQHTSFDSAVMTHSSRESTLDRNRRRSSGEGKYGTMSSISSMGISNPSPPLSETGEDYFLRTTVEALQKEVDKLREERLKLLRETVILKRENTDLKKKDLERDLELRSAREEIDRLKSRVGRHENYVSAISANRGLGSDPAPRQYAVRTRRSVSASSQPPGYFPSNVGSRDPHRFDELLGRTGTRVRVGKSSNSPLGISLADLEGETTYL